MALFVGVLGAAAPARAVELNPLFASSFTCANCGIDPNTVISLQGNNPAQAAINAAAHQVASQFGDNMTSNILFYGVHGGTNGFLAASISGNAAYSYNQYTTALAADAAAHPQNVILNTAVAHLGSGNGANQANAIVAVNTTDARVLGLGIGANTSFGAQDSTAQFDATGNFLGGGGLSDGIVFLNVDQPLVYSRSLPAFSNPPGTTYDAQSAMEHEINEVLGIGGAGSQLNDFHADSGYAKDFFGVNGPVYGVLDLYRYQAPGVTSFDPTTTSITGCGHCSGLPSPYFSVDGGATSIDTFNQAFPRIGGDAGDWGLDLFHSCPGGGGYGGTGDVQDAHSCNNQSPDVMPGTPSYKAFEAIGYNGVPEPTAWALMVLGFAGLGAALRRRRTAAAATA